MFLIDTKLQHSITDMSGDDFIFMKMQEELSELINCLSEQEIDIYHLSEEICDVYTCLYRLRHKIEKKARIRISRREYSLKQCIYNLSRFQQLVSKSYLYNNYKSRFFYSMNDTYNVICCLVNKYKIKDKVQEWIEKKQERDSKSIEYKYKYNKLHIH
jgi:hypothetical protein